MIKVTIMILVIDHSHRTMQLLTSLMVSMLLVKVLKRLLTSSMRTQKLSSHRSKKLSFRDVMTIWKDKLVTWPRDKLNLRWPGKNSPGEHVKLALSSTDKEQSQTDSGEESKNLSTPSTNSALTQVAIWTWEEIWLTLRSNASVMNLLASWQNGRKRSSLI